MTFSLSRRAALKALGASVGALAVWPDLSDEGAEAFTAIQKAQPAPKLRFLTAAQYATTDAVADTIIPTDEHSPGASAARVADYIDLLLSESDAEAQSAWTAGLAALDAAGQERFKAPLVKLTPAQRGDLLLAVAGDEAKPVTPLALFFKAAKDATIRGYYTSEIGIHKELQYKGNQFLGEFVGCTHPEHGYVPPSSSAD
jgi:hypothetical protein